MSDGVDSERNWRAEKLQWLALGILLGSKDHRGKVDPIDFIDTDMQSTVENLSRGNESSFHYLTKLFKELGVEWRKDSGTMPVDAAIEVLKLDAKRSRVINHLSEGFKKVQNTTIPATTEAFFERVIAAAREITDSAGDAT